MGRRWLGVESFGLAWFWGMVGILEFLTMMGKLRVVQTSVLSTAAIVRWLMT